MKEPEAPESSTDPRSVSQILKQKRLELSLTLEQVVEKTKITKRFITAIEEDEFDIFPATVYLRGFIVNLCEIYQIDPKPLLEQLDNQLDSNKETQGPSPHSKKESYPTEESIDVQKGKKKVPFYIISIAAILGVVAVGWLLSNLFSSDPRRIVRNTPDNQSITVKRHEMLSPKETFDLKEGDQINILFENNYRKFTMEQVREDEIQFSLGPSRHELAESEKVSVDVNKDQSFDMEVSLKKISGKQAIVHLRDLNYADQRTDYEKIWRSQDHVRVNKEYTLLSNQQKTPIKIYIKALRLPSHLSYHLDGRRQNTTRLEAGQDIIINADEHLEIVIGNYKSVICVVNNIPINLTLDADKHSITKIVKWIPDPNNEIQFDLVIKDYTN